MKDHENVAGGVREDPLDAAWRSIYADSLIDDGQPLAAERQRWFAAVLGANPGLGEMCEKAVESANAKQRKRTVSYDDAVKLVCGVIARSRKEEVAGDYQDGGGVANSYGYAATTALLLAVAVNEGGAVRVVIAGGVAAARPGGGTPANVWPELLAWRPGPRLDARLKEWASKR
jgi:hypothetical protein